jgi:hypothetical protein
LEENKREERERRTRAAPTLVEEGKKMTKAITI